MGLVGRDTEGFVSCTGTSGQFIAVSIRLFASIAVILVALCLYFAAVRFHQPDTAQTAGWLMAPVVWLIWSACSRWKKIPVGDKVAPKFRKWRNLIGLAAGLLIVTVVAAGTTIALKVRAHHKKERRISQLLERSKALGPQSARNRMEIHAILNRDVKTFGKFRSQMNDLEVALNAADSLDRKKRELLGQLSSEFRDSPSAIVMIGILNKIDVESSELGSLYRSEIDCSKTLAQQDESNQRRFASLCESPVSGRIEADSGKIAQLLSQARQLGVKLPPDVQ